MSAPALLTLALLALSALHCSVPSGDPSATPETPTVASADKFRGVTFDAHRDPGVDALRPLADLGIRHILLTPFAFQPTIDAPELRVNYDARYFTEGDAGIRRLAEEGRALGMDVILKPHLWVGRSGWTADIAMNTEADWQAWEAQYRDWALHYARLSEEIDAPLFVFASELAKAVQERPGFWRSLIADVRGVYSGEITYAANWHGDYEHVPFWDAVDYVGVQAYFPLSRTDTAPGVARLAEAWQPHLKALEQTARQTGKPILFTEIGYRSVPYAAREPWRWPERGETVAIDTVMQAQLYEAFFETVWPQPWLAGAAFWKFYPPADRDRMRDFTPQGKPAEAILRRSFGQ